MTLDFTFKPRECFTAEGHHKQTYTRKQAKSRAKRKGSGLVAYRCEYCSHWHCGTKRDSGPRSAP